jgi:hypothetical protein
MARCELIVSAKSSTPCPPTSSVSQNTSQPPKRLRDLHFVDPVVADYETCVGPSLADRPAAETPISLSM